MVIPGAEPFQHDGGPVGVLLIHGFTGSPFSLRPWADRLAAHDLTVSLPRLPGHGTRWQDMQLTTWDDWYTTVDKAFRELTGRCEQVFVMGLSMGAALALRLAQRHGTAVSGLVLVNPAVVLTDKRLVVLPVARLLIPSFPGIVDDIKRPGVTEHGYARTPLRALHSLRQGQRQVEHDLAEITQPLLMFRSTQDHVVPAANGPLLLSKVSSVDLEERLCQDSYHVATLDNDAEAIFTGSLEFVRRLAPAAAPAGSPAPTAES